MRIILRMLAMVQKKIQNNKNNKDNRGCRGCKYLESVPGTWGTPYECWYPRKSKTSPVRVDLERFRKGCKGRIEVDKCRTVKTERL
jgi:hypothetical protein